MISGMGTPDVLGTAGKYTLFTTKSLNPQSRGKQIMVKNEPVIETAIEGPKYNAFSERKVVTLPLKIERDITKKTVTLSVKNQTINLNEGQFSDWVKLEFKIDFFTRIPGIAKFYLKQAAPDFELYLSPINFDPENPLKPISYPASYSKKLAREYGLFYTQGLPHDTWALEEGVFDDKKFLENADSIFEERRKIYFGELDKFKSGIFFNYIGVTDTISHMFWRKPEVILSYYQKVDELVGETLNRLDDNDVLIILSDHGFAGFDYEFNLNSWLRDNGYLVLEKGTEGKELLDNIDWSKTKAYAIGYNGIYFNLKGREKEGIVDKKETKILGEEIKQKLLRYINPENKKKVIKNIYFKEELGVKDDDLNSPDLFVGYYKGVRSSWDTAVGATPKKIIKKRESKWSGDHLFDATEIPGILFSNKKIIVKDPKITDVIPLVLKLIN